LLLDTVFVQGRYFAFDKSLSFLGPLFFFLWEIRIEGEGGNVALLDIQKQASNLVHKYQVLSRVLF
jgi:hypothetical protein